MSIARKGCCWEQRAKEERTLKCPLEERAVAGSNIQKRKGHRNVKGRIRLSLGAMFKRGEDSFVSMGGRSCH
jgi:hypothetical protein